MSDKAFEVLDHFTVYIIINKNMFLGSLMVTNQGVAFKSQHDIKSDAFRVAGGILFGTGPYNIYAPQGDHIFDVLLPYSEIASVEIQKSTLIINNLVVKTKQGEELRFKFGMLSPKKP